MNLTLRHVLTFCALTLVSPIALFAYYVVGTFTAFYLASRNFPLTFFVVCHIVMLIATPILGVLVYRCVRDTLVDLWNEAKRKVEDDDMGKHENLPYVS